jgi:hypothetical protein
VLRAHLSDEKRCYLHPHRVVQTACARCKTPYCDECLEKRDDGLFARIVAHDEKHPPPLFCARCIGEVGALAEIQESRKLRHRLRPTRAGLHRAAIWLAVLSVILVPMTIAVRGLAETTLTPEELGRIRLALSGGFQTPDGIDLLSQPFGGAYIRASVPARPDHQPSRLIDTWASEEVPGWRSAEARFPQELVFQLPQRLKITSVVLRPQPAEPFATWVQDFELLVSEESPDAGFRPVARGTLPAVAPSPPAGGTPRAAATVGQGATGLGGAEPGLKVDFEEVGARYVMLRVLSNHGSQDYVSLGEIEVYWTPPGRR